MALWDRFRFRKNETDSKKNVIPEEENSNKQESIPIEKTVAHDDTIPVSHKQETISHKQEAFIEKETTLEEPAVIPDPTSVSFETLRYAFVDTEVGLNDRKVHDIGALRHDGATFHQNSRSKLIEFLHDVEYICGHNIIHHDIRHLFPNGDCRWKMVDTLYLSPLMFPERPYHRLVKDEKLLTEQANNPVADCKKAFDLLFDEVAAWQSLPKEKQILFASLLRGQKEFDGFLDMMGATLISIKLPSLILKLYAGKLCEHADLKMLVKKHPVALAYALALVDTSDYRSITPPWVLRTYPAVEWVLKLLRGTACQQGCDYCNTFMDVHYNLKLFFGYDHFRTYDGVPLQENATRAAVHGKSLLAIFPTGGGKSLTFQLPALMDGRSVHGLTVVISPLQSLMKDQVDNLTERDITDAVTINGMLNPIERALAIQRVQEGDVSILYIAPEMLRSSTIERILLARHVVRFVIDEAHCFSSWGQDFRVDYLYIGKFIAEYQRKKELQHPISVSCFTATAKQKVVQDICDYFRQTLGLELDLFTSTATRTNLHYSVIHTENDDEKYQRLRSLIMEFECPTIIYASRTKRTIELAARLSRDGYKALPFNGKMETDEKIANQDAFMNDRVHIIVATSAFGMGVDKKDVGLVVHYDISDSLENYVQEAGRAGRDPSLEARCYVLYGDNDLDKHFILLNQTKLSISEIQQVWKAIKELTRQRTTVNSSALEIARLAGWDDSISDIETRVRTAISALEQSGYLIRGNNVPHVYATGITVKDVDEARKRISDSILFEKEESEQAVRIIKSLISQKYITKAQDPEGESRIDYLADKLGLTKRDVISAVERMRQVGILADSKDISAYLLDSNNAKKKSQQRLEECAQLEEYLIRNIPDTVLHTSSKQLNDNATKSNLNTKEKDIRTLLGFLAVKGYIRKQGVAAQSIEVCLRADAVSTVLRMDKRLEICRFAIEWLYNIVSTSGHEETEKQTIHFSIKDLLDSYNHREITLFDFRTEATLEDIEEALLYLSHIKALELEGGFLVIYQAMKIERIKDNRFRYSHDDYRLLNEFYKQKMQQVHIVGEYANLMVRDYNAALQFVQDYFQMDYKKFIAKYFKGNRKNEIERNITPQKYKQLFNQLSPRQMDIISDKETRCIVVAAGPGSGKTRVLVHKLASLLLLEDVKHEQLLMLTFSRAAATEFKQRLMELIGNAAHFVEIKTFHSYCFDLLGRIGSLEEADKVVERAAAMIANGEVEPSRIAKTVLVIDEAQDMASPEQALVKALMAHHEEMRVIAVGDDDQNIYTFRGSDSRHMFDLTKESNSRLVEMTENYRSAHHPVAFANALAARISKRMKTRPIFSMRPDKGLVEVVQHTSPFLYQPLVHSLLRNRQQGSVCVLTQTNDEAAIVAALLRKHGLNSKLIQSLDGFCFFNMAEVRHFVKKLEKRLSSPAIPDALWEETKQDTYARYERSTALPYLRRCLELFEHTNSVKYLTDFREYLFESSVDDFCDIAGVDVVVSTIHKAKGREFDNVYMLVAENTMHKKRDEHLRCLYVGITRAKNRLFVHTNGTTFAQLPTNRYAFDSNAYTMPEEVVLQLSHRDVALGDFAHYKNDVLALYSGDALTYRDNHLFCAATDRPVAKLSKSMQQTLVDWQAKGYAVVTAAVRFVVAWKPKDAEKDTTESAVLLADLTLRRHA